MSENSHDISLEIGNQKKANLELSIFDTNKNFSAHDIHRYVLNLESSTLYFPKTMGISK